jgi:flavin reductase (DIM6/NTAB) family NADH-FMN oxidoreductase RutF
MLAENQKDLSDRFAKSGSNKWEGTSYAEGLFDAPLLPGVAAVLECGAWATHAGGDHVLFIAEVKRFRTFADRRPLVFSKGRYAKLLKGRLNPCSRTDHSMPNR